MERHEVQLGIDATQAQRGAAQYRAAIESIKRSILDLQQAAKNTGNPFGGTPRTNSGGSRSSTRNAAEDARRAAQAVRLAERDVLRLDNALRRVGAGDGEIYKIKAAFAILRNDLSKTGVTYEQVKKAQDRYNAATQNARTTILRYAGTKQQSVNTMNNFTNAMKNATTASTRYNTAMKQSQSSTLHAARAFDFGTRGLRGMENAFNASYQAGSLFRTVVSGITLGEFTRNLYKAGEAFEQFRLTMEVVGGDATFAALEMDYTSEMARRLGINLEVLRSNYSKFSVAANIAGVTQNQTREIFEAVSMAMSVMGRNAEDQKLAFLALEQMMSKGTVSSEELRRQLGERLPGAVELMAKALGVTSAELQKMLKLGQVASADALPKFAKVIQEEFGAGLPLAMQRAGFQLENFRTELFELLQLAARSGFMDALAREFKRLSEALQSTEVQRVFYEIGVGFNQAAGIIGDGINWVINNLQLLKDILAAVVGGLIAKTMITALTNGGGSFFAFARSIIFARTNLVTMRAEMLLASGQAATMGIAMQKAAATTTFMAGAARAAGIAFSTMLGPIGFAVGALLTFTGFFDDLVKMDQPIVAIAASMDEAAQQTKKMVEEFQKLSSIEKDIRIFRAEDELAASKKTLQDMRAEIGELVAETVKLLDMGTSNIFSGESYEDAAQSIRNLVAEFSNGDIGIQEFVSGLRELESENSAVNKILDNMKVALIESIEKLQTAGQNTAILEARLAALQAALQDTAAGFYDLKAAAEAFDAANFSIANAITSYEGLVNEKLAEAAMTSAEKRRARLIEEFTTVAEAELKKAEDSLSQSNTGVFAAEGLGVDLDSVATRIIQTRNEIAKRAQEDADRVIAMEEATREREAAMRRANRKTGGGGNSDEKRFLDDLQRLLDQADGTAAAVRRYSDAVEIANTALAQGLLTNKEYANILSTVALEAGESVELTKEQVKGLINTEKFLNASNTERERLISLLQMETVLRAANNGNIDDETRALIAQAEARARAREEANAALTLDSDLREVKSALPAFATEAAISELQAQLVARQEIVDRALEFERISQAEHYEIMKALQNDYEMSRREVELKSWGLTIGVVENSLGSMAEALKGGLGESSSIYKAFFAMQKAAAIAQATVNTATGITEALKLPPPMSYIQAGAVAAAGAAQVATIVATTIQGFKDGGRVRGPGTSTSDSITARLSDGEFVVNARQTQKYLPLLEKINRNQDLTMTDLARAIPGPVPANTAINSAPVQHMMSGDTVTNSSSRTENSFTVVQNYNIQTPDADSFRKSRPQLEAEGYEAAQRSYNRNR